MNKNEIIEAVHQYVLEDKLNYAVLINGSWGSGKTFLYQNYLVPDINSIEFGKDKKLRKTNIYISLYGTSNVADLAKEVLTNFMIYAVGNGNKKIKQLYKPVDGILALATKAISFSAQGVSFNFEPLFKGLEHMINPQNMVICFDDLERCTIPVNDFFGFVNNLVEHCNSKVIILADENNIGKIYANTNIESKYLTILSGNRKVIEAPIEKNNNSPKDNSKDEITIDDLKKLNEKLFSENYLYKDIKEKVIGRTFWYFPNIKDTILEILSNESMNSNIVNNSEYKSFLLTKIDNIVSGFTETRTINIRIIMNWIVAFEPIYTCTKKNFSNEKYYEDIITEFLRYSIWVMASTSKNQKIQNSKWGNGLKVHLEDNEFNSMYSYAFIDAWIKRNVKDKNDLFIAAKSIITNKELESERNPSTRISSGKKLSELRNWYFMSDDQVETSINELIQEIKENKYVYRDYSNIIIILLQLKYVDLLNDEFINNIQSLLIKQIQKDTEIQSEDDFPRTFETQEQFDEYKKIYEPIRQMRNLQNHQLDKNRAIEENIFKNSSTFFEHCEKREAYYCNHHSFTEYVNVKDIFDLVVRSSLEDIYEIVRAFKKIYHMSNIRDFYVSDIDNLVELRDKLKSLKEPVIKGKTHKYAITYFINELSTILENLGYTE